jgi:Fimbrial assembly protein (PilN)
MSLRQQINLYQPALGQTRQALSATTFAIGLVVVLAGLIAFTVHAQMGVNRLNAQVELLRAQSSQQQDVLTQLSEIAPDNTKRNENQKRIAKLTADLKARQRAVEVLRDGGAGQAIGFAPRMEALARKHTEGVWLEHMQLSGVSGAMTLGGVALNPSSVPQYLQTLSSEKALSGTRFDEFVIERPDAHVREMADGEMPVRKSSVPSTSVRFHASTRDGIPITAENPS